MSSESQPSKFNIIKHRQSPTTAVTETGHTVHKAEFVMVPNPMNPDQLVQVQCADYHNEHFVYIDPMFYEDLPPESAERYWWAMCTCGSPAVMIGGADVSEHQEHNWLHDILERGGRNVQNMLVCQHYHQGHRQGHGWHQGQSGRKWS